MPVALGIGVGSAITAAWLCDDAFISFRYARNLVEGHGLVFNVGERVEGYTNLLWTLLCAAGLMLGVAAERWSHVWSITAYAVTIVLLAFHSRRMARTGETPALLPLAALGAACLRDWNYYATSGLETSLFTALALGGYLLVVPAAIGERARPIAAGIVLALASLTRPDGVIFAAVAGAVFAAQSQRRVRDTVRYAVTLAAILLPAQAWRFAYYGEWVPNTYYAKSAWLARWPQGLSYLRLFAQQYWPLLVGPVLLLARPAGRNDDELPDRRLGRIAAVAGAFGLAYAAYVARIGGDFMHARMLIPTAPFFLIVLEAGVLRWRMRPTVAAAVSLALLAGLRWTPPPVTDVRWRDGVANEWMCYSPQFAAEQDRRGEVYRRYFADLPVVVAFLGGEARDMYVGRVPVAIESHAGLTDRQIARQPLERPGRVGHEKPASLDYLVSTRGAHFAFNRRAKDVLRIEPRLPLRVIELDNVQGLILHWDPAVMESLRRRGAKFKNFLADLDDYLRGLPDEPLDEIRVAYAQLKLFYFDHVSDSARERPFLARLNAP